jgi:phosphate transport system permease protein
LAEQAIFAVALSAILMVFLIFVFVIREALPILFGRTSSALVQKVVPAEEMDRMSPAELQAYLGLTDRQFREMDAETKRTLMEVRAEAQKEIPAELRRDQDAHVNTLNWRYLILPHPWAGYSQPVYVWQPISPIPKYNVVPLCLGSLKMSLVALLFSVPLALGAAIYVSQLASPKVKEWVKPAIEMLAAIPSVVLGFFALLVIASVLQRLFGYPSRLNAFVAGTTLGLAVIPVVFTIAEDSLSSVPRSYTAAALALGSSRWQAAWQIVLPAALPGVFAAVVLGFGRAVGETMIVLMASGNASIVSWSLFDSARTITATIAAEVLEAPHGGAHYRVLFLIGTLLFLVTLVSNSIGDWINARLKRQLEGRK